VSIESFCEKRAWALSANNVQTGGNQFGGTGVGSCSIESEKLSNSLKLSNNEGQIAQNNSGSKIIAYETQKETIRKKGLKRKIEEKVDYDQYLAVNGPYGPDHHLKKQKTVAASVTGLPSMKRLFVDEMNLEKVNFDFKSDSGDENMTDKSLETEFNINNNKRITDFYFCKANEQAKKSFPNEDPSSINPSSTAIKNTGNNTQSYTGKESLTLTSGQITTIKSGRSKKVESTNNSHISKKGAVANNYDESLKKQENLHPLSKDNKKLQEEIKTLNKKIGERNIQIKERDILVEKTRQENTKILAETKKVEDQSMVKNIL
jgi:hypothetical protein